MTDTFIAALAVFLQEPDPSAATPVSLPSPGQTSAIGDILHHTGPVAIAVLVLLALLSLFSWTIIIAKYRSFGAARTQSARFLRAFRKSGRLSEVAAVSEQFKPSPRVGVFT
jgi:biopolymer transport protein TolQ